MASGLCLVEVDLDRYVDIYVCTYVCVCTAGLDFHVRFLTLEFKLKIDDLHKYSLTIALPLIWNLCSNSTLSSGNMQFESSW